MDPVASQRTESRRLAILDAWVDEQITSAEYERLMIFEIMLHILESGQSLRPDHELLLQGILAGRDLVRRGKNKQLTVS